MRISAVPAWGLDGHDEAERALFHKANIVDPARLPVQAAIAGDQLWISIEQPSCAPAPARLFVRDGRQGQATLQLITQIMKIGVGNDPRRGATFHV